MIIGGHPVPDRTYTDLSWMNDGLCTQFDPETFFPEVGQRARAAHAKFICNGCPVKAICLDYGMLHDEYGIWGGMTQKARRRRLERLAQKEAA